MRDEMKGDVSTAVDEAASSVPMARPRRFCRAKRCNQGQVLFEGKQIRLDEKGILSCPKLK